ncbi:hypothetical protein NM688_g3314 [Phlebia brevispora]|uniref:Uncharacterized protein n=1 Tax=Phlebia brevispora TaxID=194682 RepID=A0ACC1T6I0_9APHY|nr:hypothetical protein NM688_g3314 [Phlebia brevispora]
MAGSFTIDQAGLVGLFMEALLYGIYVITFWYCMKELLYRHGDRMILKSPWEVSWYLLAAVVLMAVILTEDLILLFRQNLVAFIWNSSYPSPAIAFFEQNWINVVRNANYVTLTGIGDSILIYRLFRLYNSNLVLIMPLVLMWTTGEACGIVIVIRGIARNNLTLSTLKALEYTSFSLTVVINVISTSLIIVKLWMTRARVSAISFGSDRLFLVMRIILDSGLIYTLSTIVVISTLSNISIANCVSDATIQIIGICFNLIIIRISVAMHTPVNSDEIPLSVPSSTRSANRHSKAVNSESGTPLTTFRVVAETHSDLGPEKSTTLNSSETWGRGVPPQEMV